MFDRVGIRIPGSIQARLGLVFLLLTAVTTSLFGIYWLWVLEPRLEADARTQANIMAHSHAWLLSDALDSSEGEQRQELEWTMDEILVLTDPITGKPFIEGISVELDGSLFGPDSVHWVVRGNNLCPDCFTSEIPLYAKQTRELLGIATFHSNNSFFEQLRSDVRKRLYLAMAVMILLLSSAWWIISSLLTRAQRSDAMLGQTFDAMSFPVFAISADLMSIIRSNKSAQENFSPQRTAAGRSLKDIFHDSHDFDVLRKAIAMEKDITGFECELRGYNDNPYWALLSARQVNFHDQQAVIISIAEVTQLKYAENIIRASEERFSTVVDSIDDLVYVANMETYELLFMNRAARKVFGETFGRKCWEVLRKDQTGPCEFCTNDRIVDKQGQPCGVYTWDFCNTLTNEWYTCRDRAIRWVDGTTVRLETATNITELKKTQKALEQARDEAETASRAKSQFLATMSHEIRTPLNGIIGMVKLLMRSSPRPDQREYLDIINLSSEQLLLLINDILDISKVEAGKLKLESHNFDLNRVVEETVRLFELHAREKGLVLEKQIDPATPMQLYGDATRLRQVLLNLVSNAIKFTREGSVKIEISGQLLANRQAAIRISVSDTGVGIPAEYAQKIFEEFTQLDMGSTRGYEGTGLGLAISRRLLNAMGGDIRLSESGPNGSTFIAELELPLAQEQKPHTAAASCHDYPLQPQYILLVEDNAINSKVAKTLLEQEGHTVELATNGAEALQCLEKDNFDLVLMDLHMPVMDGIQATRELRRMQDRHKASTPVIALTANIMQEERDRCIEVGMDHFLAKPFTPEKLNAVICQTLSRRDANQRLDSQHQPD
ncbi:MAG: response regulator [Gammaproteobacteria bacterium]|nr:response regulator [Gammaproteobacteria bacterium]